MFPVLASLPESIGLYGSFDELFRGQAVGTISTLSSPRKAHLLLLGLDDYGSDHVPTEYHDHDHHIEHRDRHVSYHWMAAECCRPSKHAETWEVL